MRLALVACASARDSGPAPAEQLYSSALFHARRRHVAQRCDRWFVLTPRYGLVAPDALVEAETTRLADMPVAERAAWAEAVLADLDEHVGRLAGCVVEMHAGVAFCDSGLVDGLQRRGASVARPVAGLGQGRQLAWYREHASGSDVAGHPADAGAAPVDGG